MTQVPTDYEWVNTMGIISTIKYYFALTRSEVPTCATTWMKLEELHSVRGQAQRITRCMISFI